MLFWKKAFASLFKKQCKYSSIKLTNFLRVSLKYVYGCSYLYNTGPLVCLFLFFVSLFFYLFFCFLKKNWVDLKTRWYISIRPWKWRSVEFLWGSFLTSSKSFARARKKTFWKQVEASFKWGWSGLFSVLEKSFLGAATNDRNEKYF